MLPTIGVLIPTYNRSAFLQKALDSALAQDYPQLEVVISDNASTDDTESLRKHYESDTRVRWFRNESNIGLAANWRKLLYEHAHTDYVKILADDDYLGNHEQLSRAARLIRDHGVDVVFSGAGSFDDQTQTMVDRSWSIPSLLSADWWMTHIGQKENGKTLFPNLTTGGIFRLEKAKALKAFVDPVFGMDYQLGFELMLSGPSGYLTGVNAVERKHNLNDGFNAPLEVVITCLQLYSRVLDYGKHLKLDEAVVRGFCRRFMTVMVDGFLLFTWARERGVGLKSYRDLRERLANVDPELARSVLDSPASLARFFIGGHPKRQEQLRRLYYRFCLLRERWRTKPQRS